MLRDRSVLVVDDEESIRMLLEEGLSGSRVTRRLRRKRRGGD